MNPRYLAYCKANGMSPDEMLDHDKKRFPGGRMCGFIVWNTEMIARWKADNDIGFNNHLTKEQHGQYTAWLEEQVAA